MISARSLFRPLLPLRRPGRDWTAATDAELALAARDRDRAGKDAFVEIVRRHQAAVSAVAYSVTRRIGLTDDIAQETFLKAWKRVSTLRELGKLKAWLTKIAHDCAVDALRRERPHASLDDEASAALEAPGAPPDKAAADAEEEHLIWTMLESLPENMRTPLVMFYREGESVAAVAAALDLSEDAVKQRLSRGRELLREKLSGVVEGVLRRRVPAAVFIITIATAIGALTAPAALAAASFSVGGGAASSLGTAGTQLKTTLVTAMKASKTTLATAAALAVISVPAGYAVRDAREPAAQTPLPARAVQKPELKKPDFSESGLYAEWRRLHEAHQPQPDSMPALFTAIQGLKDPFRRRAFRSALIAEWAEADPQAAWQFFTKPEGSVDYSYQLLHEWMAQDGDAAVTALLSRPERSAGWPQFFNDIAAHASHRMADVLGKLPVTDAWDPGAAKAFALMAAKDLSGARALAESLTGTWRERALNGVVRAWAERDAPAALAWAQSQPEGLARDEWVRHALAGWATHDPLAALDRVDLVPPGGDQFQQTSNTAARVLKVAAEKDFDATLRWLKEHPGKLGQDSLSAIGDVISARMTADPAGFADFLRANDPDHLLQASVGSALLNNAYGCKDALWDWIGKQPADDSTAQLLRQKLLSSASWHEPLQALKWLATLPDTPEFKALSLTITESMSNSGLSASDRAAMIATAPEPLRARLVMAGLALTREGSVPDIPAALTQYELLPANDRGEVASSLAFQWSKSDPEAAIQWMGTLNEKDRIKATEGVVSGWAAYDSMAASKWIADLPAGAERDAAAKSLAMTISESEPESAWRWSLDIKDPAQRTDALAWAYAQWHRRNPVAATQAFEAASPSKAERAAAEKFLNQ